MADLTIKPVGAPGNKLILQDQAGNPVLTTSDSGATVANATLTTPTIADMANCTFPAGHPIQVVNRHSRTRYDCGAGAASYEELHDYYVTITPKSASHKIYVTFSFECMMYVQGNEMHFKVEREVSGQSNVELLNQHGGSSQNQGTGIGYYSGHSAWGSFWLNFTWVDSPNTTTAVKYQPFLMCSDSLTDSFLRTAYQGTARSIAMEVV